MVLTHRVDPVHRVEDLGRLGIVIVMRPLRADRSPNARVEGAADDNPDAAFYTFGKEGRQRLLLEQGVTPGKKDDVPVAMIDQPFGRSPFLQSVPQTRQ